MDMDMYGGVSPTVITTSMGLEGQAQRFAAHQPQVWPERGLIGALVSRHLPAILFTRSPLVTAYTHSLRETAEVKDKPQALSLTRPIQNADCY